MKFYPGHPRKVFLLFHQQAEIEKPNYNITDIKEIKNWNLKNIYLKEVLLNDHSNF
jgi:hypothetical protein